MVVQHIPLLPAHTWETSYRHEDGDLVELFFVPALCCAVQYDRMTGYFSADTLALAARGIERLIANDGRMRLIVGCTLETDEIQAIERGYDLRKKVEEKLEQIPLDPPDAQSRHGLASLAWLIAAGRLDVKVAVPVDGRGKPVLTIGIYHEKVGIISDPEGNKLSFSGSINETRGGWINNRESFHVHCDWEGGREQKHVADEVGAFQRLWDGDPTSIKVYDFPDAVLKKLLDFLPKDDRFVAPPAVEPEPEEAQDETAALLTADETRQVVWTFMAYAARMWNGARVGEVTSTVHPWPHQLRTFARMLESWPCRLLISDEVGLGKTISAGLLIRQAWLSGLARRILVMVPRAVMIQWQNELYEKFNLNVPIYDGQKLVWKRVHGWKGPYERKVDRKAWHHEPFVLCSSYLMRRRDRAADLLETENWDLVVLDEAHHARRKGAGTAQEGGPNALLRLMQQLQARTRALVLLTATPMQVHPVEIWDLLNLLGLPPRWAVSSDAFVSYFELAAGNPSQADMEFLAEMFQDVDAEFGPADEELVGKIAPDITKLNRQRVLKALRDRSGIPLKRLDSKTRQAALEVLRRFSPVRHRMSRHTRGLLRLYYERGLLATPIAKRDVRDIPVELSPGERALYDAVEDYIGSTYNNATRAQQAAVGFVMTIYRRRLASSFQALRKTLTKHLADISGGALLVDEEDAAEDELAENVMDSDEASELARAGLVAEERSDIQGLLRMIAQLGTDSKAKRLRDELKYAFNEGYDSAIVFTQYTDTMDYLKEYLAGELPEVPIACYSGTGGARRDNAGFWTMCSKEAIKLALKNKSVRLLICTDAAGEGLNLQFCGVVANYDLPWNPMKVEQRIGRIDRIGQAYPVIRIINLAYQDTVEADVYFALGQRINLFQGIVGKLQPILSRLPKKFEELALTKPEHREAAKQQFLSQFERMTQDADDAPFDIDEVAIEALEMPKLLPPALTLEQIDAALNQPRVRPQQMEWKPLDAGSYAITLPGMAAAVRATTSDEVFDDHFESHQFLSPGGPLFEQLKNSQNVTHDENVPLAGRYWLVVPAEDAKPCEMFMTTAEGPRRITSLNELLDSLTRRVPEGELDRTAWPNAQLVVLA